MFLRQNADLVYDDEALSCLRSELECLHSYEPQVNVPQLFHHVHTKLAAHPEPVRFIYDEHQVLWAHGGPFSPKPNSPDKKEFFRFLRTWSGRDAGGVSLRSVGVYRFVSAFPHTSLLSPHRPPRRWSTLGLPTLPS